MHLIAACRSIELDRSINWCGRIAALDVVPFNKHAVYFPCTLCVACVCTSHAPEPVMANTGAVAQEHAAEALDDGVVAARIKRASTNKRCLMHSQPVSCANNERIAVGPTRRDG